MGKTILVRARKGGVGKTMTAANLGFGFAKQGKRVLLLDCDSQKELFEDSVIYGIAQDNPATTLPEQCRYDVCLIISNDSAVNDDVIKGESPSGKYAVFTVIHTVEAVQEFYGSFMNILQENKMQYDMEKPILERYKYKLVENGQCEFCVPIL